MSFTPIYRRPPRTAGRFHDRIPLYQTPILCASLKALLLAAMIAVVPAAARARTAAGIAVELVATAASWTIRGAVKESRRLPVPVLLNS
jgi:hypothetical protein